MATFDDLVWDKQDAGQAVAYFENGYGVSVIKGQFVRGNNKKPYELAAFTHEGGDDFELTYSTPITDDVIGYLTQDGVSKIMNKVKELPSRLKEKTL